ncbi:hypothetical protein BC332_25872 [Capsicum chinense]|nr:hypothetical protein BC332_25872 [Capsicum chinense]
MDANPFKKFEEYRKNALMHSIQNYLVTENIFEIRIFNSHHGKGGNKKIVNEMQRSCTCSKWQSNHFPCSHAIRVFEFVEYSAWNYIASEFSVVCYKRTYTRKLNPLGDEDYWPESPFSMIANKSFLRKIKVKSNKRTPNEMDVSQPGHDKCNCPSKESNAYGSENTPGGASTSRR